MDGAVAPAQDRSFLWTPGLIPGWLAWSTTAAAGLWTLWMVSIPGEDLDTLILLILLWWVLGAAWLVRVAATTILVVARLAMRRPPAIPWWRLGPQLAIVAAVWFLVDTTIPLQARFVVARGSLEHDAKAVLAGTRAPKSIHRSGGYSLTRVELRSGSVLFYTTATEGFAYAPRGVPRGPQDAYVPEFHRFRGPWYRFDTPGLD